MSYMHLDNLYKAQAIVDGKAARAAIGRKTAQLLKARLNESIGSGQEVSQ